jgi:hypothetical protein
MSVTPGARSAELGPRFLASGVSRAGPIFGPSLAEAAYSSINGYDIMVKFRIIRYHQAEMSFSVMKCRRLKLGNCPLSSPL